MFQERGFTIIELVASIVLIGILIFTVASRYSGSSITLSGQLEQLASDIRYIQTLSMTLGERHCIFFNTAAASYQLRLKNVSCTAGDAIPHPATGSTGFISLSNVTMSASNISSDFIEFDGLGKPFTLTAPASNGVITLTSNGESRTVNVIPETGGVQVP